MGSFKQFYELYMKPKDKVEWVFAIISGIGILLGFVVIYAFAFGVPGMK